MNIPFWKMHGAGNDFLLFNCLSPDTPVPTSEQIATWCRPHTGIGADGVILVQAPMNPEHHFFMRFFNPDGSEASMCGNGARCVARFAYDHAIAPDRMCFETAAGLIAATVQQQDVTLDMQAPQNIQLNEELSINGVLHQVDYADTGVPHVIVICPDVDTIDILRMGNAVRYHDRYAPEGTNVDFIQILENKTLRIRTYERGVEAETLACGTGVAAAAVICIKKGILQSPVEVQTAGGDSLTITLDRHCNQIRKLQLTGPAVHVFHGYIPVAHEKTC